MISSGFLPRMREDKLSERSDISDVSERSDKDGAKLAGLTICIFKPASKIDLPAIWEYFSGSCLRSFQACLR
ncbi:MAG: hypothetical protein R6U19_02290, partial [Bacteroidales bacterium]